MQQRFSVKSPIRYVGGKNKGVRILSKFLPQTPINEYREPFLGGANLLLNLQGRLPSCTKFWGNDLYDDLIVFWQQMSDPTSAAIVVKEITQIREMLKDASQVKGYYEATKRNLNTTDPIRRAVEFFFFNRVSFSGTILAGGFSRNSAEKRFTWSSIRRLENVTPALKDVLLTNDDFQPVIQAPGENVFIYVDPPYYTTKKLYGKNGMLHSVDHHRIAEVLKETPHKFLLTYDDCPAIYDLYKWANIRPFTLQYGMANGNGKTKDGNELLISNY